MTIRFKDAIGTPLAVSVSWDAGDDRFSYRDATAADILAAIAQNPELRAAVRDVLWPDVAKLILDTAEVHRQDDALVQRMRAAGKAAQERAEAAEKDRADAREQCDDALKRLAEVESAMSEMASEMGKQIDEREAQLDQWRPVVEAARELNEHYWHTPTGAAGTDKRREWEIKLERLGQPLNEALRVCDTKPAPVAASDAAADEREDHDPTPSPKATRASLAALIGCDVGLSAEEGWEAAMVWQSPLTYEDGWAVLDSALGVPNASSYETRAAFLAAWNAPEPAPAPPPSKSTFTVGDRVIVRTGWAHGRHGVVRSSPQGCHVVSIDGHTSDVGPYYDCELEREPVPTPEADEALIAKRVAEVMPEARPMPIIRIPSAEQIERGEAHLERENASLRARVTRQKRELRRLNAAVLGANTERRRAIASDNMARLVLSRWRVWASSILGHIPPGDEVARERVVAKVCTLADNDATELRARRDAEGWCRADWVHRSLDTDPNGILARDKRHILADKYSTSWPALCRALKLEGWT